MLKREETEGKCKLLLLFAAILEKTDDSGLKNHDATDAH